MKVLLSFLIYFPVSLNALNALFLVTKFVEISEVLTEMLAMICLLGRETVSIGTG
jgi:hypothetical protein